MNVLLNARPVEALIGPGTVVDLWGVFALPGQRQRSEVILQRVRVLAAPPLSAQAQDRHEVTLEVFEEAAAQLEQIRPHLLGEAFALRVRGADQGLVTHDDGRVNPRALALARSVAPAPAP